MSTRRPLVYIMILLSLFLGSSCDMEYRDSANASVSIQIDENVQPDIIQVDLISGQTGIVYKSVTISPSIRSVSFPSLLFGSYSVRVYGYSHGQTGQILIATGTGELTCEDKGVNSATVVLSPITDSSFSGTVKAEIALLERGIENSADTLSLVYNGNTIATHDIAGKLYAPYKFEEVLPCMDSGKAFFQISIGEYPVAHSEDFDIAIYAGQTIDLGLVRIIPDEDVVLIDSVNVEHSPSSPNSLTYSFLPPDSQTAYRCIIVRYSDGQATFSFELAKDKVEETLGDEQIFYTGTISGLREGTQYTISVGIEFEDGSRSPFVQAAGTTTIPLRNISINRISSDLQPGDSFRLTLSLNPSDATDLGGTWTSSDENIAKVDQNGNLVITGYGQVAIRYMAVNGNRSAQVVINISLTPPELTVIPSDDVIELTWTSSKMADSFELYRKVDGESGDGTLLATTKSNTYTDTTIQPSHTYSYRIKATDTKYNVSAWSEWSEEITQTMQ